MDTAVTELKIKTILDKAISSLCSLPGICAVVLGGSRARDTHTADSDIDIGIYYDADMLELAALNAAARQLDDEHRDNLIASPGAWGKWVNGGGWLVIDDFHVDFILRDVIRVEDAISECRNGKISAHYQTGHPHAYINAMYMGELAICKMLWDKDGSVSELKRIAESYPPKLKQAMLDFFIFEAGFSMLFAENNADRDDIYYVTAHIVRSISALNQVLFAINEEYCINEKKAVGMIEGFKLRPRDYKCRISKILADVGTDNGEACRNLADLIEDIKGLVPS